ncbi:MAG: hypothetical protein IH614_10110 [Desulfuromonadales bacterium]|nr:hypothetical protein [Desulfuromonadales bacterium]
MTITPQVARLVAPEAPREAQLMAARGAFPLPGDDLLTVLFVLCHRGDPELRREALRTLTSLPANLLVPVVGNSGLHPHLLDFVARVRPKDIPVMEPLLANPATPAATLVRLAAVAQGSLLSLIACNDLRLGQIPELAAALIANPHADRALKYRLGWTDPAEAAAAAAPPGQEEATEETDNYEPPEEADEDESTEAVAEETITPNTSRRCRWRWRTRSKWRSPGTRSGAIFSSRMPTNWSIRPC